MKFTGIVATTNPDQDGEVITDDVLKQLAETAVGKPVSLEFKHDIPKTRVISSNLGKDGQTLSVEARSTNRALFRLLSERTWYAVPGYQIDGDNIQMTSIGLTINPADKHVTPVSFVYEDGDR